MHDGHDHGPISPTGMYGAYLADGPIPIANYGYLPTTVSVKDGSWFDPTTWSNGVPTASSILEVRHHVKVYPVEVNGDINGDGTVDVEDYKVCTTLEEHKRFGDVYFGLAISSPGNSTASGILITPLGCLEVGEGASLSVGTIQVLGCFELFGGELSFKDYPFDYVKDAMQWGHGLITHSGGSTITRGGRVYSENPLGVRGHFAILHSGTASLKNTKFHDLGRTVIGPLDNTQLEADKITAKHVGTNQMARYGGPHFHHCWGPSGLPEDVPQFEVIECEIYNGTKWGITIHQSHYGHVIGNKIYNVGGAGIAFEDGNEFANEVKSNKIWNVYGDGKGVQGHNGGQNVADVGDGTAANPYRTIGSHGNEGAGIWGRCVCNDVIDNDVTGCSFGVSFWSRFQPNGVVSIPAAKGEHPSVKVPAGGQLERKFSGNSISDCNIGMQLQGLISAFEVVDQKITAARIALETSYNSTLRFVRMHQENCREAYKNGFTGRLELIDCRVERGYAGFDLPADIYIEGGVYETNKTTFIVQYKSSESFQTSIMLRGPRFTGTGNHVSYQLGDLNKNRGYHAPRDLYCYDWNGVEGDNFQVWMLEQDKDYIPVNNIAPHEVRITPEPGITNEAMLDKYLLCLGGRITPPYATTRPKISGKITPLPADIEQPQIINHTQVVSPTGVTVKFETTKPTRFRSEWNLGDIKWGKYANLVLPIGKEFKTSHEFTINGLLTGKKYGYIVQVVDEHGNLGGDIRVASMNYIPRFFTPKQRL